MTYLVFVFRREETFQITASPSVITVLLRALVIGIKIHKSFVI